MTRSPTDDAAFAETWATVILRTSYLTLSQRDLVALLTRLTGELVDSLRRTPVDESGAAKVGAALVAAGVRTPESIGDTVALFLDRFLTDRGLAGEPGEPARHRLATLLGALTTGYVRALRDWVLDEQDEIRRAALLAREQAERALRESEARFRYRAHHDSLTKLANRTRFTDRLAALFSQDRPADAPYRLAVCFLDLDGFKIINDTLGYQVGDQLLVKVAERLRERVPEGLVARLGGDEFVILLEDTTSVEQAIQVAETLLAAIAEPIHVGEHRLTVSAGVGIVERDIRGTTPTELMRAADLTLRQAKASGHGRWALFDPVRNERQLASYALSAAIPRALERDEFFLEYQPIVSVRDGTVLGAEALVRWRHPEWGLIMPDRFIGLAEEAGLINQLGEWVLREACREAGRWPPNRAGAPLFVSVNLAMRQVRDPGLVTVVTDQLAASGLPADKLQLEITEQAVVGGDETPVQGLRRLADLGIRIAIDDFGTGYSNLAYLRQLPLAEIKLAGSFVAGLRGPVQLESTSPYAADGRIIGMLILLAHSLGLTVTAEGVETATQAEWLQVVDCDAAQGWHFGRPMSAAQLVADLTRRHGQPPG